LTSSERKVGQEATVLFVVCGRKVSEKIAWEGEFKCDKIS
jgi:hypothetical protein